MFASHYYYQKAESNIGSNTHFLGQEISLKTIIDHQLQNRKPSKPLIGTPKMQKLAKNLTKSFKTSNFGAESENGRSLHAYISELEN